MAREVIGGRWNTNNLDSLNKNFRELYDGMDKTDTRLLRAVWDRVRDENIIKMMEPVQTYADLPTDVQEKTLITVLDEQTVYGYSEGKWTAFSEISLDPYEPYVEKVSDASTQAINNINSTSDYVIENIMQLNQVDVGELLFDLATQEDKVQTVDNTLSKVYRNNTSSVNIFVDASASAGGDGSEQKPFKTIQAAVDYVPKIIDKDHFIKVAQGSYNEEVVVKGITGAAVWISRKDGVVNPSIESPNVKVRAIAFYDCNSYCKVESVEQYNASSLTTSAFIRFSRCSYGTVNSCKIADSNNTKDSLVWDGSRGGFNSCFFDGQKTCAISMNGSAIRVDATNKHGSNRSTIGVQAQAADMHFNGNVNWMSNTVTPEVTTQGGNIKRDVSIVDLSTKNGWLAYNDQYKPKAVKLSNGMVQLQGIITDGAVGAGIYALTLPEGYRPISKHVFGPFVSDGSIGKVLLDGTGNLSVESASGKYVSLSDISFYAG